MLNERYVKGGRIKLGLRDAAAYVHVDDGVSISAARRGSVTGKPACNDVMELVANAWQEIGVLVPERVEAGCETRAVGYVFQADPPVLKALLA